MNQKENQLSLTPQSVPIPTGSSLATPRMVQLTGQKNTYINNIQNVGSIENKFVIINPTQRQIEQTPITASALSEDFYNLLVFGPSTDLFDGRNQALMPKSKCLIYGTKRDSINSRFCQLTEDDIALLKTFPALILNENTGLRGETDPDQMAMYGSITDIRVQDEGVLISFHNRTLIPQTQINKIEKELGLHCKSVKRELNNTHWIVKETNLREVLSDAQLISKYI